MLKLPFPSNFSTLNLVFDTEIYYGGILALSIVFSFGTSVVMMFLDYKWSSEIVKTHTVMLKIAKIITLVHCFTKQTP
jgi:hypothetical protein